MTSPASTQANELAAVREALAAEYEIRGELGRGGMAIVYHAREIALDRDVAIKVLPFALALDDQVVERFQREARTAARLEHPNIVSIHRVGRAGQVIYFVMKYLRGRSLGDIILERGRLPAADIRRVLADAAGALAYAARRGVVHRDVKPDNIMLDEDGRAVVTDFGIARLATDPRLTATGMSMGTPSYMSPEQARAKPLDARSDIYSLGVVAYEALTGTPPFSGDDPFAVVMDHINTPVPKPPLAAEEERALWPIIERMLAKKPEQRFPSCEELLVALGGDAATVRLSPAAGTGAGGGSVRGVSRAPLAPTAPARAVGLPDAIGRAAAQGAALARRVREHGRRLGVAGSRWGGKGVAWARGRGGAFWVATAAIVLVLTAGYWSAHFLIKHRTRCPAPVALKAGELPEASSFSVLVEAPGTADAGGELDLYYDVCGLADGTSFQSRVEVSRNEMRLKRLFGAGVAPLRATFDHRGRESGARQHETIELRELPAGDYTVKVSVTDARGRVRERSVPLAITD